MPRKFSNEKIQLFHIVNLSRTPAASVGLKSVIFMSGKHLRFMTWLRTELIPLWPVFRRRRQDARHRFKIDGEKNAAMGENPVSVDVVGSTADLRPRQRISFRPLKDASAPMTFSALCNRHGAIGQKPA